MVWWVRSELVTEEEKDTSRSSGKTMVIIIMSMTMELMELSHQTRVQSSHHQSESTSVGRGDSNSSKLKSHNILVILPQITITKYIHLTTL